MLPTADSCWQAAFEQQSPLTSSPAVWSRFHTLINWTPATAMHGVAFLPQLHHHLCHAQCLAEIPRKAFARHTGRDSDGAVQCTLSLLQESCGSTCAVPGARRQYLKDRIKSRAQFIQRYGPASRPQPEAPAFGSPPLQREPLGPARAVPQRPPGTAAPSRPQPANPLNLPGLRE